MSCAVLQKLFHKLEVGYSYLKANFSSLVLAFVWVLFMVFFTYTTLVFELMQADGDFCELFYQEQSRYLALFVNAGIVVMLLFDNHVAKQRFHGYSYYIPIVALILCLVIMAHCDVNIHKELQNYWGPISHEYFSIVMYGCFLFLVYVMKVRTLVMCDSLEEKKEMD